MAKIHGVKEIVAQLQAAMDGIEAMRKAEIKAWLVELKDIQKSQPRSDKPARMRIRKNLRRLGHKGGGRAKPPAQ